MHAAAAHVISWSSGNVRDRRLTDADNSVYEIVALADGLRNRAFTQALEYLRGSDLPATLSVHSVCPLPV